MAATPWIISNPLFSDVLVPFVLVFVLIFAILEKSKILGEDKKQINALISLAIGLIFLTFSKAVDITKNLIPFLAVFAVVILIFFILYGFIASEKDGLKIPDGVKWAGLAVILIGLIIAVLVATGKWNSFTNSFTNGNQWVTTGIFIVVIAGAIIAILYQGKDK